MSPPPRTFRLTVDTDIPLPEPRKRTRMTGRAIHAKFLSYTTAAAATVDLLETYGLDVRPSRADLGTAAQIVIEYAQDPMTTAKKHNTPPKVTALSPAALRETSRILTTFGHSVVQDAVQVRHLVTNRLIDETENPDPRVRMKALELLGKISDVGLFSDKSEITITHQTSDDLKDLLKNKLQKLVDSGVDIVDAEVVDPPPVEPIEPEYNKTEEFMDISDAPDWDDDGTH